jgi:hypothetical protein
MQCWLDVALRLGYLQRPEHVVFDERFEQVIAQLVRMITDAEKWCTLDR